LAGREIHPPIDNSVEAFQRQIQQGIAHEIPPRPVDDPSISHAPKRPMTLTSDEKKLALCNALRYFPAKQHEALAPEFAAELAELGRIYMLRYRPTYQMTARALEDYPSRCSQAAAIMLMIQNNLDPAVAQHPYELVT